MMYFLIVLAVSLAPVFFLFNYIYLQDKYDREPLKLLILCFVFGVLTAFPAVIGEMLMQDWLGYEDGKQNGIILTLVYAVLGVAFVEEGVKYLVLRFYMYNKDDFDEPYDGIIYAVAISLGFAAIENILYVADSGLATGLLRAFTAVPGHAMFAVVMGYFVGRAKFLGHDDLWKLESAMLTKYGNESGNIFVNGLEVSIRKLVRAHLSPQQNQLLTASGYAALLDDMAEYGRQKAQFQKGAPMERLKGLFAATIIHGLYDYFLFLEDAPAFVPLLALVVLGIGIYLARKVMKIHQENSPFRYRSEQHQTDFFNQQ